MRLVNADDDAVQLPGPFQPSLPPILEPFRNIRITASESPADPRLPDRGPPITSASVTKPFDFAAVTGSRTVVPGESEERGIWVDDLPLARYGPLSTAFSGGISEKKEKLSNIADIGTKLVKLGIVGNIGKVRFHVTQIKESVEGQPSQKFYSGGVTYSLHRSPNGFVDVFLDADSLGSTAGVRGGFKFADGGLASMNDKARAMFGKPRSMGKEPRPTALSPGTNPGVAGLCGVARNMNRSVVA